MLRKRFVLMNADGGGDSGGGSPSPTPTPAPAPAPAPSPGATETFSATYVKELRQESAGYRLRAQEAERKANEAAEAATKAATEADNKIKEATKSAETRVIKAELKAFALKAGIVDVDGLQFIDLTKVKLSDAGEVEGAEPAIEALKKAKPYLFTKTTSSTQQPPNRQTGDAKKAGEMTDEEYRAERKRQFGY